jgi:FtsZ-interacting cell division protein YlmF
MPSLEKALRPKSKDQELSTIIEIDDQEEKQKEEEKQEAKTEPQPENQPEQEAKQENQQEEKAETRTSNREKKSPSRMTTQKYHESRYKYHGFHNICIFRSTFYYHQGPEWPRANSGALGSYNVT